MQDRKAEEFLQKIQIILNRAEKLKQDRFDPIIKKGIFLLDQWAIKMSKELHAQIKQYASEHKQLLTNSQLSAAYFTDFFIELDKLNPEENEQLRNRRRAVIVEIEQTENKIKNHLKYISDTINYVDSQLVQQQERLKDEAKSLNMFCHKLDEEIQNVHEQYQRIDAQIRSLQRQFQDYKIQEESLVREKRQAHQRLLDISKELSSYML